MDPSDLKLIHDAKHGDPQAFASLVRSYQHFVFKTAFGVLNNAADADDAAQETFLKVHRSLGSLRDERTFPAWLARIATRTALDLLRQRHKRGASGYEVDFDTHAAVDIGAQVDLRLDMQQALGRLSPQHRAILVLREIQGFEYAALAQILRIPLGTVRSRLFNARAQLRAQIEADDADVTGRVDGGTQFDEGGHRE